MRRLLRYLRLAFSAVCIVACVLLIVLWLRSYKSSVFVVGPLPGPFGSVLVESMQGRMTVCVAYGEGVLNGMGRSRWGIHYEPLEEWEAVVPSLHTRAAFTFVRWRLYHYYLILPYWFLATLSGVVGIMFFQREALRFGLRTLLVAMTLVAVVLGAIVHASR